MRYRRGLVVGKFAPLHRGHELVIRRALEACDEVVVLSYSKPELPGCPPERRARWLAELFPGARRVVLSDGDPLLIPPNDADGSLHRAFVAHLCREHLDTSIDAVFSSEDYGPLLAAALGAAHVPVDPARATVPISGTRIRADVHAARAWLSPAVYASFVGRVCVLGGESSGKTALAEALARHWGTSWVPEYGRALWTERGGALRLEDMVAIARRQRADEDAAARTATRWLFCDTSPLTTAFYSQEMFGQVDPALAALVPAAPYALTVLCAPDFPFVQDGTRRDPSFRARQHAWYLERMPSPWILATGSVVDRVLRVNAALGSGNQAMI